VNHIVAGVHFFKQACTDAATDGLQYLRYSGFLNH